MIIDDRMPWEINAAAWLEDALGFLSVAVVPPPPRRRRPTLRHWLAFFVTPEVGA